MTTSVLSQALRTPRAGQLPLIINLISLWPLQVTLSVQRRRPPSLTPAFSPRARPSHVTLVEVCDQTHEYCELFMIIRSLSTQSHDKLGAAVFKLMIIFAFSCIQTQLIVFMPNAGLHTPLECKVTLLQHGCLWVYSRVRGWRFRLDVYAVLLEYGNRKVTLLNSPDVHLLLQPCLLSPRRG